MSEDFDEIEPFTFSLSYFIVLYFVMMWAGLFPSVLAGYWYFITFPFSFNLLYLILLIPLFFALYGIALLSSLISTKAGIWLVHKRITYPEPGIYRLSMDEPQARAYITKGNIKNFARWLFYFFRVSFLRAFWLRRMGVKVGKNVRMGYHVEDEDFIEIGDNTFMSRETVLTGHQLDQVSLILCKMIVGKNCIFSFPSGSGGGFIGDNSIFRPMTSGMKGIICRGNAIYYGVPCKKVGEYSDLSPSEIEEIKQHSLKMDKIDFIKEKNRPIKINEAKMVVFKVLIIIGGIFFAALLLLPYILFFRAFYSPGNHLINIALLTLAPIFFLIVMGAFLAGIAVTVKLLLVYYDRKGEIPEGYYELDDPRAKIFKIKYMLRIFGLRVFRRTPLKITDVFALYFWGNVTLGKNVILQDSIVDPQYLEVGDHSVLGVRSRIHTHDIVNGKLYIKKVKIGKNVIIGGYVHIKPGVEIADGSVAGVAAWFRKNRKCKRPALWLGKPAFELPLDIIKKGRNAKDRYID